MSVSQPDFLFTWPLPTAMGLAKLSQQRPVCISDNINTDSCVRGRPIGCRDSFISLCLSLCRDNHSPPPKSCPFLAQLKDQNTPFSSPSSAQVTFAFQHFTSLLIQPCLPSYFSLIVSLSVPSLSLCVCSFSPSSGLHSMCSKKDLSHNKAAIKLCFCSLYMA